MASEEKEDKILVKICRNKKKEKMREIELSSVLKKGKVSLEETLTARRSVRNYRDEPLTLQEISQLLWACDGKTSGWGGRTSPSAGATYPLEIYIVIGNVEGVEPGLYHYLIENHSLVEIKKGDLRKKLSSVSLNQTMIVEAPVSVIISGIFERTTTRYGERGIRYVFMEAGHCGQNIHLQCEALGLGAVMVGAFDDEGVKKVLGIKEDIFYICPVGKK